MEKGQGVCVSGHILSVLVILGLNPWVELSRHTQMWLSLCDIWGKTSHLSEPQVPHVYNENDNNTNPKGCLKNIHVPVYCDP